jgi:thioredoxin 1
MAARITKADFEEKVLKADKPVLVEFYSDSCIPCKQLSPILGDIEDENEDKLYVYKVNVNYEAELAEEYNVMSSPTLILFNNGNKLGTKRGLVKKPELEEWIKGEL